jgi:two-component system, NarL family, invasion response regulator UvrY
VKLLVAAGDAIVRKGFREIVRARPGWEVWAEAGNGRELVEALGRNHANVVVLELPLDGANDIDVIAEVRRAAPLVPLLIFASYPEEHYGLAFLRAGANGFVRRNAEPDEILNAVVAVADGGNYISAALSRKIAHSTVRGEPTEPHERLSARELEVFRLLALGRSPTEIAGMLQLSVKTVSTYRARILDKTGFRSNADIVGYAIRNRLV